MKNNYIQKKSYLIYENIFVKLYNFWRIFDIYDIR